MGAEYDIFGIDEPVPDIFEGVVKRPLAVRRAEAVARAKDNLIDYLRLLHEDPSDPLDPDKTRYQAAMHHKFLATALEKVEAGTVRRLIINMPPRHGKTELVSRGLPAWALGRNTRRSVLLTTYSGEFARDLGSQVKNNILHPATAEVFPALQLRADSKASNRLVTTDNGMFFAVGQGGAITGRGGDILLVDDPIKNAQEARSKLKRETLWAWFNDVFSTRTMTDEAAIVIIMTRWHEDDLVGRLIDPHNPHYDAKTAKQWHVLNCPALAEKNDMLGRKPGRPLWPQRFSQKYLKSIERQNPLGFSALYQGRPSPETGSFFDKNSLLTYASMSEIPDDVRDYCASDHAVSTEESANNSCMIPAGLDSNGVLWIYPDIFWKRADSMTQVNAMIHLMKKYRFLFWWAERGHITKSIGPFLRKRMAQEQAICAIREVVPSTDKMQRAQSIHGRISMGLVRFPAFAEWWGDAKRELLQFPYGSNDDFVDTMSLLGLGMQLQSNLPKITPATPVDPRYKVGTLEWVKRQSQHEQLQQQRRKALAGW